MKRLLFWTICWLNNVFLSIQYPPLIHTTTTTNFCDRNKAELVEHFFTVIFSEFRNPSPVCVCVQMCVNQATYCYPNGCMKKSGDNKKPAQERLTSPEVNKVLVVENKKPLFLVDNAGNQVAKFNVESAQTIQSTTSQPYYIGDRMHLYSLDNLKTVYKYRKLPKVHLQYNLREQIKNTKSNIYTDVASNRWPLNKLKQVTIGKSYQPDMSIDRASRRSKYFRPIPSLVPRFSKRDLRPSEYQPDNLISNVVENMQTGSQDPEKFPLEKMINDLIESSMDNNPGISNKSAIAREASNISDVDVRANIITSNDRILPISAETLDTSSDLTYKTTSVNVINDTTNVINNKTLDYDDDPLPAQTPIEMFQNIYNDDSIESLSKRIDKLNNTSYEIMNMNNDHIEAIPEDSRSTEVNKFALLNNCTSEKEEKFIKDDDTSKNSTSLLNN